MVGLLSYLTKRVDNAPLILFRICFGFLLAWQSFYDIYDGKAYILYIEPKHLFPFIGFEWLQPLPGYGMYVYHIIMGIAALGVCAGLFYRYSLTLLTLLWAGLYFMQKTSYNNHHYLILLLCLILFIMPANRYASADCYIRPALKKYSMPRWCVTIIIVQLFIVYFFASVAKIYPGWLNGSHARLQYANYANVPYLWFVKKHIFHLFIAWGGVLFDMFIIPALLFKRTRTAATVAMIFFHLFNFCTLEIGIFPALSIAFLPFFYPPDTVRKFFFPKKPALQSAIEDDVQPDTTPIIKYILFPFAAVQLLLPLRPYLIPGNVFYTEEGSRIAWRMKLTVKSGEVTFRVAEKPGGSKKVFDISTLYTPFQIKKMSPRPDMIWQAAQRIKQLYAKQGKDVAVYATAYASLNGTPKRLIINPETDLATAQWDYFSHSDWILLNDY